MLKRIAGVMALIITVFPYSTEAAEEITGAFGISFGQPLAENVSLYGEPYEVTSVAKINGVWQSFVIKNGFDVNPPQPNEIFEKYYVVTTPLSSEPYAIGATRYGLDSTECLNLESVITKKIATIYPTATYLLAEHGVNEFSLNFKSVRIYCSIIIKYNGDPGSILSISYKDKKIEEKAIVEQIEISKNDVSSDGF